MREMSLDPYLSAGRAPFGADNPCQDAAHSINGLNAAIAEWENP